MMAGTVGGGLPPDVGRGRSDGQTARRQAVLDAKADSERVALLGMEDERHEDAILGLLDGRPVDPAGKPVQRVVPSRLGEWRLVQPAGELVLAVLDPVGPGEQQLTAPDAAHLVLRK